jgi:hypothetical protein
MKPDPPVNLFSYRPRRNNATWINKSKAIYIVFFW